MDVLKYLVDERVLVCYGVVAINCVLLFNLFIWGYLSFFIIMIAMVCGYFVVDYILKKRELNNYLPPKRIIDKAFISRCDTCENCISGNTQLKCVNRHMPWKGLYLSKKIDSSVDKLLSKIIKTFITNWYENISNDSDLIKEIKLVLRFATSVLLKRLLRLNYEEIVFDKMLPICLNHIRQCQKLDTGEKVAFHYAVSNRKFEIMYLKKISSNLLPFITQKNDLQCKIFRTLVKELISIWVLLPISDVVCNPATLVFAWTKLSIPSITSQSTALTDEKVEFLSEFIDEKEYDVQLEMCSIFKDSTILHAYMNFLKRKEAAHLLQFCLDVDQFNKRMLKPEISSQELDLLYRDAWDIFSVYFSSHSPNCISFDFELVNQLRKVLSKDVIKLQNSKPLYEAYDQTYSVLENRYWKEFHNSDEYFSWICGPRNVLDTSSLQKSSNEKKNLISKLKMNRIKGALKSSTVYDGQIDSLLSEYVTEFGEDLSIDNEIVTSERNLNTWRVTDITSSIKLDSGSNGGQSLVFFITIESIENDILKQWCVERRLADFYTLQSKLTEFHGVFLDARLPSKRIVMQKTENNEIYMQFLNQLLQKHELRGSDLLHMFLTSIEDFDDSESAIGRLIRKSMPLALRKERGQNLESFISIFMNSIESKLKQRYEWKDLNEERKIQRKFHKAENSIFGNNLNINNDNNIPKENLADSTYHPCGPLNCIIFFGVHVYHISNVIIRLVLTVQSICGNVVDSIIKRYITNRVVRAFSPSKISNLIELLESLLFPDNNVPQKTENQISVEQSLNTSIFLPLHMCFLNCTKNAVMNKQLFYRLLDVLLPHMFPELQTQFTEQLS